MLKLIKYIKTKFSHNKQYDDDFIIFNEYKRMIENNECKGTDFAMQSMSFHKDDDDNDGPFINPFVKN